MLQVVCHMYVLGVIALGQLPSFALLLFSPSASDVRIQGFFHVLHVFGSHLVVFTGDPPDRESLPADFAMSFQWRFLSSLPPLDVLRRQRLSAVAPDSKSNLIFQMCLRLQSLILLPTEMEQFPRHLGPLSFDFVQKNRAPRTISTHP